MEKSKIRGSGKLIYEIKYDEMKSFDSNLTERQWDLFERCNIQPYIKQCSMNIQKTEKSFCFDKNKSYSSFLIDNKNNFNVCTIFDDVKPFSGKLRDGEFYIVYKSFELEKGSKIGLPNGFYPFSFVGYCNRNKYISLEDIAYEWNPSNIIKYDSFRDVEYIFDNFTDDAKCIVNCFTGLFGQKYDNVDKGCMTSSKEVAIGLYIQHENENVTLDFANDLYFIRTRQQSKKYNMKLPIYKQILCGGIMNLNYMYKDVKNEECEIVCYNTDSLRVHNPQEIETGSKIGEI